MLLCPPFLTRVHWGPLGGASQWAEPDLAYPLPGSAKSPDLKTLCNITRSARISCTSCRPRTGWKNKRRSTWLSDRPRRPPRPRRTLSFHKVTEVAEKRIQLPGSIYTLCPASRGLGGVQAAGLAASTPCRAPAGAATPWPPMAQHKHLLGEMGLALKGLSPVHLPPSATEGSQGTLRPQAMLLQAWFQPKPSETSPLLSLGPGTKGKINSKGE